MRTVDREVVSPQPFGMGGSVCGRGRLPQLIIAQIVLELGARLRVVDMD